MEGYVLLPVLNPSFKILHFSELIESLPDDEYEYSDSEYYDDSEYYESEHYDEIDSEESDYDEEEEAHRIRCNQLNPCNDLYWQARGYECRPSDWKGDIRIIRSTYSLPTMSLNLMFHNAVVSFYFRTN